MPHATPLRYLASLYAALRDDNAYTGAAALAFYLTLALFPAIVFLMAIIPFLPIAHVGDAIADLLRQALPGRSAELVASVVRQVAAEQRGGLLSAGFAGAVWAASTGMHAVMRQLNTAYDVPEGRGFVRARATALGLTVLFGALVLAAFSLVVLGGVIQDWIGARSGYSGALLAFFAAFRWVVIVLALLVAFSVLYKLGPNVEQQLSFFAPGSVVATTLLIAASLAFSLYTRHFGSYDVLYGSIGAVIVLMLWLYLAGIVIIVGCEINVLSARTGQRRSGRAAGGRQSGSRR